MIQVYCDNCGKKIQHEPDDVNRDDPNWKPEHYSHIEIRIAGTGKVPVNMDCCIRCTKKYVKKLTEPLDD